MTRRALALGLIVSLLAGRSSAAEAFVLSVDPRFELLGVLHQLAGRGRRDPSTSAYRKRAERRFRSYRRHPAVGSLKALLSREDTEEAVATLPIHYSAPPELALLDEKDYIPYLESEGRRKEVMRFLEEMRDFARQSDFMAFYRENRDYYAEIEGSARRRFAGLDPVAAFESYTGMSLESRAHYIIPLLHDNERNFIVPYPLPFTADGAKSFDVYTISPGLATGGFHDIVWNELTYVFIDPSFHYFDRLNVPVRQAFYGAETSRCRSAGRDCAKHFVSEALIHRLLKKNLPAVDLSGRPSDPAARALSERLEEYERRRDLYPTLWSFFPRLAAVFRERAFPGAPPLAVSAATLTPIRKTTDFFDPALKPGSGAE